MAQHSPWVHALTRPASQLPTPSVHSIVVTPAALPISVTQHPVSSHKRLPQPPTPTQTPTHANGTDHDDDHTNTPTSAHNKRPRTDERTQLLEAIREQHSDVMASEQSLKDRATTTIRNTMESFCSQLTTETNATLNRTETEFEKHIETRFDRLEQCVRQFITQTLDEKIRPYIGDVENRLFGGFMSLGKDLHVMATALLEMNTELVEIRMNTDINKITLPVDTSAQEENAKNVIAIAAKDSAIKRLTAEVAILKKNQENNAKKLDELKTNKTTQDTELVSLRNEIQALK